MRLSGDVGGTRNITKTANGSFLGMLGGLKLRAGWAVGLFGGFLGDKIRR